MSSTISRLFDGGRDIGLQAGEVLFRAADRVGSVYWVTEGRVDLVRHAVSGRRLILARAGPGTVPAEASAYSDTYHCDGLAGVPSTVRRVPVAAFLDRLERNADASRAWATHLARALQQARLQAELRSLKTVAQRLEAWLGDDGALPARGRWQDLAQVLGVSREALYRELARRRRQAGP